MTVRKTEESSVQKRNSEGQKVVDYTKNKDVSVVSTFFHRDMKSHKNYRGINKADEY